MKKIMLEVLGKNGFLVLRTKPLRGWELKATRGYYEAMGYTVREFGEL